MNILVTGAAGFIGNQIMQEFIANNYDVVGWDCIERDNVIKV